MQVRPTAIADVVEIVPERYADSRGSFCETYNEARFAAVGLPTRWVQDNQSVSAEAGTVRGLHLQLAPHAQDKLVRVLAGAVFDVAVDLRPGSASLGRWVGVRIDADTGNQLLVPKGFAHGFMTLEPDTVVLYKVSAPYAREAEAAIAWDDPELAIDWPQRERVLLSDKDAGAGSLAELRASAAWDQIL